MPMSGSEFLEGARAARSERLRAGRRNGPSYCGDNPRPLIWHDQVFGRELAPAGDLECPEALRVGATQNSLDVAIVASHANAGPLSVPEGASLTVIPLQGDTAEGGFAEVGPSVCVTAPAGGLTVEPDMLLARFALGGMQKPWCKVKLSIDGAITGGLIDVALAYTAR